MDFKEAHSAAAIHLLSGGRRIRANNAMLRHLLVELTTGWQKALAQFGIGPHIWYLETMKFGDLAGIVFSSGVYPERCGWINLEPYRGELGLLKLYSNGRATLTKHGVERDLTTYPNAAAIIDHFFLMLGISR